MSRFTSQAGFTAVELLITLFIAAAFIGTAYQLYTIIVKNGADSRNQAIASNIAYDNLRRYSANATSPCSVVTPSPTPSIPSGTSLVSASITVTYSCPYGTSSTVTKVVVAVKYGSSTPQQEVDHAIFVSN